jgi:hypothetical protein
MDIRYPTLSAPQLLLDAAVHAMADTNTGAEGSHGRPVTPELCCPFCRWEDEEVGPRKRNHVYARPDSLGRHIRDQHLTERDANEGFDCPYEGCSAFLSGGMHFLNHAARQHGLTLWYATKR